MPRGVVYIFNGWGVQGSGFNLIPKRGVQPQGSEFHLIWGGGGVCIVLFCMCVYFVDVFLTRAVYVFSYSKEGCSWQ